MPNINDAEITDIYVSQTKSAGVQDDAPNMDGVTPATQFDVTLEMVAGSALASAGYTLTVSCADLTTTANALGLVPEFPQVPAAPGTATVSAPAWTLEGSYFTYSNNVTVPIPGGAGGGQVYQYTASLIFANGEVASVKQSDLFSLS
jgi:hypothetical protein